MTASPSHPTTSTHVTPQHYCLRQRRRGARPCVTLMLFIGLLAVTLLVSLSASSTPLGQCMDVELLYGQMSEDRGVSFRAGFTASTFEEQGVNALEPEVLDDVPGCDISGGHEDSPCFELEGLESSVVETSSGPLPGTHFGEACFDYPVRCSGFPAPNSTSLAMGGVPGVRCSLTAPEVLPRGWSRAVSSFAHTGHGPSEGVINPIKYPPRSAA